MRSLIAIAALVISVSATGNYLVIDLRSTDYFWMTFDGSQEKRLRPVTFNKTDEHNYTYGSPFAARRYVGAGPFEGYISIETFTVKRHADKSSLVSATATPTGWPASKSGEKNYTQLVFRGYDFAKRWLSYSSL